ncbi:hypothetical protein HZU72_10330 [Halomonas sp. QX-2]|uniref:Uncharacterized protein n=2 Tax=Vreelandella sedimenti TaxID=2729618 RepID=A0A7Z0N712_9GAMM|nr:hypothetical protein [Halomonas sedimenti]
MRLELDEPEAPTLLYFPHAELASEEDWLLDTIRRYNESTLAEMRTDYVIPLTTKLASYVEKLEQDKGASTSAAEAKGIEKELSKLYKQQAELHTFDEKLRHYADQRISLDLDDGVKVNYGKFGDLLAEMKAVTGEKAG